MTPLRKGLPLAALALLVLAGCEKDEVRQYQAVRIDAPSRPRAPTKLRLLAAIAPQGDNIWVFKFLGGAEAVGEQKENFDAFVRSLALTEESAKWKLPEGWTEDGPSKLRYATIHAGARGSSPQLTVFKLPKSPTLENVNRWRTGDLGLGKVDEARLKKVANEIKVGGKEITVVDMTGPGPRKVPPAAKGVPKGPGPAAALPFTYKAPPGWVNRGPRPLAITSFRVPGGADVTVSAFAREFGGMRANVNRWREQVGLPDLTEAQFAKVNFPKLTVDKAAAESIDLSGPNKRMLVVVVPHRDATYFFKMIGDDKVVAKEKAAFEAFLKSIVFRGE